MSVSSEGQALVQCAVMLLCDSPSPRPKRVGGKTVSVVLVSRVKAVAALEGRGCSRLRFPGLRGSRLRWRVAREPAARGAAAGGSGRCRRRLGALLPLRAARKKPPSRAQQLVSATRNSEDLSLKLACCHFRS